MLPGVAEVVPVTQSITRPHQQRPERHRAVVADAQLRIRESVAIRPVLEHVEVAVLLNEIAKDRLGGVAPIDGDDRMVKLVKQAWYRGEDAADELDRALEQLAVLPPGSWAGACQGRRTGHAPAPPHHPAPGLAARVPSGVLVTMVE